MGKNLAVSTTNNTYLDGLACPPEYASRKASGCKADHECIYLWMSDYHPDGGQLFWPIEPIAFCVCLGPATVGDRVTPDDMRGFIVPEGYGIYIHPGYGPD